MAVRPVGGHQFSQMSTPLDHPWLTEPHHSDWHNKTIRVAMKSAIAMLADSPPPRWIVTLDETSMHFEAHTRVVVSDVATIDVEGDAHDGPVSSVLTESQTDVLVDALSATTQVLVVDVDHDVLDGVLCVLTVINGSAGWCAFSQFNSAGMNDAQLGLTGPRMATIVRSFYQSLSHEQYGP
jgi:hypothetical protein